ncbi:tetratricopeptide repeat protein [Paraburkholderia strydomiana]|uniref:Tetratricopeptide repeat protein n=1 Tax=Paraburkholderia strydomiana TaxID=1245417 RepID=A0ABW9BYV1_9BURK
MTRIRKVHTTYATLASTGCMLSLFAASGFAQAAAAPDATDRVLDKIAIFAERICPSPNKAGSEQINVESAEAKVELSKLLRLAANVGAKASGAHIGEEHVGPLQKDLAELIKQSVDCKERVAESLISRLLGPTASHGTKADNSVASETSTPGMSPRDMAIRGDNYSYGRKGFPVSVSEAIKWYTKAAKQGDSHGAVGLGRILSESTSDLGLRYDEAFDWFSKADAKGDPDGTAGIGLIYFLRGDYTKARQFIQAAAARGSADGEFRMATFYLDGTAGEPQNEELARELFMKAAAKHHSEAENNLGVMYAKGQGGLTRDEGEAESWFTKAWNDDKNSDGESRLGWAYEAGFNPFPKSDKEALRWYTIGALKPGHSTSKWNVGKMYEQGRGGLTPSDTEAVGWYKKAADEGESMGMVDLARMYEEGRGGLPRNEAQANALYRKAAADGNAFARNRLVQRGLSW